MTHLSQKDKSILIPALLHYRMPSPMVGRKFGVGAITAPDPATVKGTRVLGISGSSRQEPGMSKSERLLL